jgi:hypothetical protein
MAATFAVRQMSFRGPNPAASNEQMHYEFKEGSDS